MTILRKGLKLLALISAVMVVLMVLEVMACPSDEPPKTSVIKQISGD